MPGADERPIAIAVIVVDRKGYIAGWNSAATALLGYGADEVIGQPCHLFLCGMGGDGQVVCHPCCPIPAQAPSVLPDRLVLFPQTRDLEILRLELEVLDVDGHEPSEGWLVHVVDIVERLGPAPGSPRFSLLDHMARTRAPGARSSDRPEASSPLRNLFRMRPSRRRPSESDPD